MAEITKIGTGFPVVGIGASAGGITALQTLFRAIPAAPDLAFVVVQHLVPDHPSRLVPLFRKWTSLPVHEVTDGTTIEPGSIWVTPPDRAVVLEGAVFSTRPLDRAGPRPGIDTIDSFFESLARDFGPRAIGVVLSGTGADGAAGAVRIKQAGGMVFVQDPTTAMHEGMPAAAIASGAADHVMPLAPLGRELMACASPDYVRSASPAWGDEVTAALEGITELIRTKAGFDLTGYKTTPLLWRLQQRMEVRRVPLFRDYERLLHDDLAELETLVRSIPIHVSEFFRDPSAWEVLEREVIPNLFDEAGDSAIRAWTPACATGEEAYSLALLLAEHAGTRTDLVDFQVFATDASAEVVARASRGSFKPSAVDALSPERRRRFFYAVDRAFRVNRALREKMVFAPQDLLADPPFTGLDLVTCRNLLIYLQPDAGRHVVSLLHSSLRLGGYLFLGRGEALAAQQAGGFREVAPNSRIYRKTESVTLAATPFPKRPGRLRTATSSIGAAIEAHAHAAAIQAHDVPAVLVDDQFQILRVYGDTAPFLSLKPGEPSLNVMQLLPSALPLEMAWQKARTEGHAITVGGLADPETGALTMSLRVTPLRTPESGDARMLVSFLRTDGNGNGNGNGNGDRRSPDSPGTPDSVDWSEALRLTHEELDASREELQALNEELRASNDQLNVANDDLNEANGRLRDKVAELETQSDVLSSGAVMSLFLDAEMRVRWFTPAVAQLFPLQSGDAGRRITDLAPRFDSPRFLDDVRAVMRTGENREAEIRTFDDRWYLQRIRPFLPVGGNAERAGVAINFTDLTDRKHVDEALRESRSALTAELDAMRRLHEFSTAITGAPTEADLLEVALDAVLGLHQADFGYVQLRDPESGKHRLAAHRGFDEWFVEHFAEISAAEESQGPAKPDRQRVGIVDVEQASLGAAALAFARHTGYRAAHSSPLIGADGEPLGSISTCFREPRRLTEGEARVTDILVHELSIALERIRIETALRENRQNADRVLRESEQSLRRNQTWLAAQKEAFQSEMNGAPLAESLGILVRAASEQAERPSRCAVYLADTAGQCLTHVAGMPDSYARKVDGLAMSPESRACGLAIATGEPELTSDVREDPRWKDWTWLDAEYGYRGCWSFPVETSAGKLVGSVVFYLPEPRTPTPRERDFAAAITHTAAIIISRHQEVEERERERERVRLSAALRKKEEEARDFTP